MICHHTKRVTPTCIVEDVDVTLFFDTGHGFVLSVVGLCWLGWWNHGNGKGAMAVVMWQVNRYTCCWSYSLGVMTNHMSHDSFIIFVLVSRVPYLFATKPSCCFLNCSRFYPTQTSSRPVGRSILHNCQQFSFLLATRKPSF